jgi:hypothetical protein
MERMAIVRPSAQYLELDATFISLCRSDKVNVVWENSAILREFETIKEPERPEDCERTRTFLYKLSEPELELFLEKHAEALEEPIIPVLEAFITSEDPTLGDRALVATILLRSELLSSRALSAQLSDLGVNASNLTSTIETWSRQKAIDISSPADSREKEFTLTDEGKRRRKRLMKKLARPPSP